ncbi:hypothetical protein CTAYLR_008944 [Chrysophaeum taylorii]|uniref:Uncharacterized protein n=1 Tax=Chrysophaeum taylorii TaxID=2483200 RepID=A0AAD7XNZ5_9STRA|nr:hypothetical protein CTAYLR_008944 [Chrysophaeum taylorii]
MVVVGHGQHEEEDEENWFWWQRGLVHAPRAVVVWDHTDESRESRGIVEPGRKVTWSELFLDLVLVTNVAKLGEAYQSGALSLMEVALLYRTIHNCWWSTTKYAMRFHTDDLPHKAKTGLCMFFLLFAGLRLGAPFGPAARQVALAAGLYHAVMAASVWRVVASIPEARRHMTRDALVPSILEAAGCLVASRLEAHVFGLLTVLAFFELFWSALVHYAWETLPKKERIPVHIHHLVERRGCIRLILMGEVVTGCAVSTRITPESVASVSLAFLSIFNMKLLAFDVDSVPSRRHAVRIGVFARPLIWLEAAFAFDFCMGIAGSCVRIILSMLTSDITSVRAEEAHVLLCASVAAAVLCLTLEHLMHDQAHVLGTRHCWTTWGRPSHKDHFEEKDDDDDDLAQARRIFYFQVASEAGIFVSCVALAAYCSSIERDYEVLLVLASIAALTTLAVVVNLLDEVHLIWTRASAGSAAERRALATTPRELSLVG